MWKKLFLGAVLVGSVTAFVHGQSAPDFGARLQQIVAAKGAQPESERLAQLFSTHWDRVMHDTPEYATLLGYPGLNDRWTDFSKDAINARRAKVREELVVLTSIDRAAVSAVDRISYDLFKERCETALSEQRFPTELLQITQLDGLQVQAAQIMAFTPNRTVVDLERQLLRLQRLPARIEQTIALLEEGAQKGITPPQITLRDVPQQVLNQIVENPLNSPLLQGFASMPPTIPGEDQQRLSKAAAQTYREQVVPALNKLHLFLRDSYLPRARKETASTQLPDGQAWYAHNVRARTTTDLTPQQIHDIGLKEVARIRGEMEKAKAAAGFEGTLAKFFEHMRTDPKFYFTEKEELLRSYRDIAKRADAELMKLFRVLPRTPYGVLPVPAYSEKSQPSAYYYPAAPETGRPGYFFANTYALNTRPKWEMEALTLHEAVPGHHLQIAIAQELDGVPEFRKRSWAYTAYVEGWGLYAESLGEEMGFYKDPYSKMGQLTFEMWRAVRLVVDTGMHALGWSRQQAIDYFKENTGRAENDIIVEVDRYLVWPGQALAYKIGELKIKELRAHAANSLGDRFDLRAFHDELLRHGAVPLDVLESNLRNWVISQR